MDHVILVILEVDDLHPGGGDVGQLALLAVLGDGNHLEARGELWWLAASLP